MPTKLDTPNGINSDDFICQPGSMVGTPRWRPIFVTLTSLQQNAAKTDILDVKPGDKVRFTLAFGGKTMKVSVDENCQLCSLLTLLLLAPGYVVQDSPYTMRGESCTTHGLDTNGERPR
jgi:hypothetical protein